MTNEQKTKLDKFRAIASKRQKDSRKDSDEILSNVIQVVDGVKTLLENGITVENHVVVEKDDSIAEAIKNINVQAPNVTVSPIIKTPDINLKPEIKATTIVNTQDIYARYNRVNSDTVGTITYHGFIDKDGNWFIQKETATNDSATTRYNAGTVKDGFDDNWKNRQTLDYETFDKVNIK